MPKPLRAPYRSELRAHSNQIGPTCAATNTPSPSPVSSATSMPRIVAQRNPVAPTTCQHVVALWHDYVLTGAELTYRTMKVKGLVAPIRLGMLASPSSPPWLGMVMVCGAAGVACVEV